VTGKPILHSEVAAAALRSAPGSGSSLLAASARDELARRMQSGDNAVRSGEIRDAAMAAVTSGKGYMLCPQ
jgi:hypothetical protein